MAVRVLTYVTLALTFAMMLLGAAVHGTGSSLACPDWPTCYGDAFPAMIGGVRWEHSHRMLGTLIGLSVIALNFVVARAHLPSGRPRAGWLRGLAVVLAQGVLMGAGISTKSAPLIALGALVGLALAPTLRVLWRASDNRAAWALMLLEIVIIQGLLGGLTVVLRLPLMVSSAHLALSMIFFVLLVTFALRQLPSSRGPAVPVSRGPLAAVAALTFLQICLGALVKHTGASYACGGDMLLCAGVLLPQGGPAHLHMAHRLLALVVTVSVIAVTIPILKAARRSGHARARLFGVGAHLLVLAQVALGLLTVQTYIALPFAVLHLGGGALLFADLVALLVVLAPHEAGESAPGPLPPLASPVAG